VVTTVSSQAMLLSPRIEAEIAFRLGTDLCGTDVVEEAARGAMAEVFLALEVIDSRFHLDGITLADSAACARFVLGEALATHPPVRACWRSVPLPG
jgi:2-keto-4-pentenoate hydratase